MADRFDNNTFRNVTIPAIGSFVVTPNDGEDLERDIRAVTIGAGGTIAYVNWEGESCETADLPEGSYPLFARRILDTGTSADDITGWY